MRPESIEFSNGMPVNAFVRSVQQYPYHWHDTIEILQILKGTVSICLGDHHVMLHENDIAVINVNELHRMTGEGENEILFIHIDSEFCRQVLPNRYMFIYCCSAYHEERAPEKYDVMKEYIARLVGMLGDGTYSIVQDNVNKFLKEMLIYTAYSFDFLRWGYGTEPFDEKRVARLRQMAEHASSDSEVRLGLTGLAAELHISVQHLSSDIKEKFGVSFQELLCYSRCEHAARLLIGTDRRIVEISEDCGFSDTKYLIKYFRYFFHCTPSEFRKAYRSDSKTLASQALYMDIPFERAISGLSTGSA